MTQNLQIKRIYEPPAPCDGYRILIDRLWPRGMSKERAQIDLWIKEIAPSTELRKWFSHQPERFYPFREKYLLELQADSLRKKRVEWLKNMSLFNTVTLLYAANDPEHNHAVVLYELITNHSD